VARNKVIQVRCDRCKRVELVPPAEENKPPDFEAHFEGEQLLYEDLCNRCKDTMKHLWVELREWERQLTHKFGFGPAVSGENAAPLEVAPNYKPPQPHSASAKK
jgi:hypothetical protein